MKITRNGVLGWAIGAPIGLGIGLGVAYLLKTFLPRDVLSVLFAALAVFAALSLKSK